MAVVDNVFGIPAHDDHEALANLIEGLKVAESACSQMAFYTSHPGWLQIREAIGGTRGLCVKLAQAQFSRKIAQ